MYVGIRRHVPAHPGAKTQHEWQADAGALNPVETRQCGGNLAIEVRKDAVEHLGQIKYGVFAFVSHRQPVARVLLALPLGTNFIMNLVEQGLTLVRRQTGIVGIDQ